MFEMRDALTDRARVMESSWVLGCWRALWASGDPDERLEVRLI